MMLKKKSSIAACFQGSCNVMLDHFAARLTLRGLRRTLGSVALWAEPRFSKSIGGTKMIGLGHPEGRIRGKSDELYGTSDELYYDKGSCLVWIMEGDGKNGWHLLAASFLLTVAPASICRITRV
jgi:hypothetical protein